MADDTGNYEENPMNYVIIKAVDSKQNVEVDSWCDNGIIEPFFDFEEVLKFFYQNTYHRRAVIIKAKILSQITETNLDKFLPPKINPRFFLRYFLTHAEIFGNAFLEHAGTKTNFYLYNLPTQEGRVDKDGNIYQIRNAALPLRLDGYHFKYYSPKSRFYGEPDYLATRETLQTDQKIDTYNDAFFENNATPNLMIVYENSEPSEKQLKSFTRFFAANFKGHRNAHKTLILSTGKPGEMDSQHPAKIRAEPLNQINDLSFGNYKERTTNEIIAAHGVPPRLVGIITPNQLGGGGELISQLHQFNELEMMPKIEEIEYFFDEIGIKLKLKPLDVTNFKDDGDVVQGLVELGIISIPEARDILGWQKKRIKE